MFIVNFFDCLFNIELIVESLPQLILNVTNAHYAQWNWFSIISAGFSGLMILYSVLKFVYYVGYLNYDMRQFML